LGTRLGQAVWAFAPLPLVIGEHLPFTDGDDRPPFKDIALMRESGLFHHLIAEEYSRESLAKIEEILTSHRTHEILPIAHGLRSDSR
jgi:hypothetical protein